MMLDLLALARTHKTTRSRSARLRGAVLVLAGISGELVAIWLRAGRLGGNVVVRCRQGHLFTTIWIPGVSVKSLRLGLWRLQRCPVGQHWSLVTPVKNSELSDEQRHEAGEQRDLRLP
jgi:hypothetical protein